jgi:arginyl-tRNA synthetase
MIIEPVRSAVADAVAAQFGVTAITPEITYPEPQFGDLATNVAFRLAKQLKRPPQEIAAELANAVTGSIIDEAVAIKGYVNLRLKNELWVQQLLAITSDYGHSTLGKGIKVEVEFISANPTGPTTIGNARGGYIGDTIARVLEAQGYEVTREYYFNNAGTQISKLVESVKVAAGLIKLPPEEVQYSGDYIKELADEFGGQLDSLSDDQLKQLITQVILKRWIQPAIEKMGIRFDSWFNEQDLLEDGSFEATIQKLRNQGLVYEQDGAVWLDTGKLGVAREARVIIKSNGDPTYLAPDIAFHDQLFGARGFDRSIKILGPDHIDQFPSVRAAVLALHPGKRLEMAGHQWFRLLRHGKEVKVSKRLGQFVTIEALIDEVGPDMARFMTLQRAADSHMDFDLDLARERSHKNPLWYVMYSYARAHSIIDQASKRGLSAINTIQELSPEEVALVRQMVRFPELVAEIATDYGVHRLTFFGIEVARLFHELYENERIIGLDKATASRRLYVMQQYIVFMDTYFKLLGITPIKHMEAEPAT